MEPPADAPEGARIVTARGPFTEADDRALMLAHGIDRLVTKNSGGVAVAGKLAAARALGIAVVMVARPPPPEGATVPDAAGRWRGCMLRRRCAACRATRRHPAA